MHLFHAQQEEPAPPDPELSLLATLADKLAEVQALFEHTRWHDDTPADDLSNDRSLGRLFAIVHAALDRLLDFLTGQELRRDGRPLIALRREGRRVLLLIDDSLLGAATAPDDTAAFVHAIERWDDHLQSLAELFGVLISLAARWTAAAFAPTVVIATFLEEAPRILQLGSHLLPEG